MELASKEIWYYDYTKTKLNVDVWELLKINNNYY